MRTTMMVMERKMVTGQGKGFTASCQDSSLGNLHHLTVMVGEEDYDEEKMMSKDGIIPATGSSSRSLS